jgi:FkbM family methyltransferase
MTDLYLRVVSFVRLVKGTSVLTALKVSIVSRFSWRHDLNIKVNNYDILIRPRSSDLSVALSSLGNEFLILEKIFSKDFAGLIVDAGGYIGTAAIKFSEMYPKAKIITIEPSTENYRLLEYNIRKYPNIIPIKAALVSCDEMKVTLLNRGTGQWGYTVIHEPLDRPDAELIEEIETITLHGILAKVEQSEIGILKMDIEGAEKEIFCKAGPILRETYAVFVELHDRIVSGCSAAFEAFSSDRITLKFGEKYLSIKRN